MSLTAETGAPLSSPSSPLSSPPPRGRLLASALWSMGVAAALSATATPFGKRLTMLVDAGVSPDIAAWILHAIPVAMAGVIMPLGYALTRGRSQGIKFTLYALLGGVFGFVTALCLDLFAGLAPGLERLVGPLQEAGMVHILGWTVAVMSLFYGLMLVALGAFGPPAARVMNPDVTPECAAFDKGDRTMFGWGGLGLSGQALIMAAMTALHQAQAPSDVARLAMLGAIATGVGLYAWSSVVLWRRYDELFRRLIVDALAWTGSVLSLAILVWAVLEAVGLAPAISAYGALMAVIVVQTLIVSILSARLSLTGAR